VQWGNGVLRQKRVVSLPLPLRAFFISSKSERTVISVDRPRIFIAVADRTLRKKLKNVLAKEGYLITGEAEDGSTALRMVRTLAVDLILLDADLPGMNGLEIARISEEDRIAPVVLISNNWQKNLAEMARDSWIFAFLLKPVDEAVVAPTIETALINYQKLLDLENEIVKLKDALEARKLVERAKGILMKTMNLSEAEAFRRIQRQSMDKCVPMKEIAKAIILSHEMLGGEG